MVYGVGFGMKKLIQRSPATFDLRAILQKCDNPRVTSNKMYKTTDPRDLKLKRKGESSEIIAPLTILKLLHL